MGLRQWIISKLRGFDEDVPQQHPRRNPVSPFDAPPRLRPSVQSSPPPPPPTARTAGGRVPQHRLGVPRVDRPRRSTEEIPDVTEIFPNLGGLTISRVDMEETRPSVEDVRRYGSGYDTPVEPESRHEGHHGAHHHYDGGGSDHQGGEHHDHDSGGGDTDSW